MKLYTVYTTICDYNGEYNCSTKFYIDKAKAVQEFVRQVDKEWNYDLPLDDPDYTPITDKNVEEFSNGDSYAVHYYEITTEDEL